MKEHKIFWGELMHTLRKKFGDDTIFLTFLVCHTENDIHGKRDAISTFAKDNIKHMDGWIALMCAKQISGSVEAISIVVRVFLKEKVETVTNDGKTIKIPKKELYHFLVMRGGVISFNKQETMENQCTDFVTKNAVLDEPGIIYKSSEELLNEIKICR